MANPRPVYIEGQLESVVIGTDYIDLGLYGTPNPSTVSITTAPEVVQALSKLSKRKIRITFEVLP